MTVAGEQPNPLAVTLDDQPVAVMLDFVKPLGAVRHLGRTDRDAGVECGFWHGAEIGNGVEIASLNE
jgi:hypothetical protein